MKRTIRLPIPRRHNTGKTKLFYCTGKTCLHPKPLKEMKWGCIRCDINELKSLDKFSDEERRRLPPDSKLEKIFDEKPLCAKHQLPIVPRCPSPVCGKAIGKERWARAVCIWGAPFAGKSVLQAVLYHVLRKGRFFEATRNITEWPGLGESYGRQVVEPLILSGVLPSKTALGDYARCPIICSDSNEGPVRWPPIFFDLTDHAGEVWDEGALDSIQIRDPKAILAYSRGSIGIFDPTTSSPEMSKLGGTVQHLDQYAALKQVLEVLSSSNVIPEDSGEAEVQSLFTGLEQLLRDQKFPMLIQVEDLAYEICRKIHNVFETNGMIERMTKDLAAGLEKIATVMLENRPSLLEQAQGIAAYMRNSGYDERKNKLKHRLAVVISKADTLGEDWKELAPEIDELNIASNASLNKWKMALNDISRKSREALVDLGALQFVRFIERNFENAGFFFMSTLGKPTEVKVRKRCIEPNGSASDSEHYAPFGGITEKINSAAMPTTNKWEITKRIAYGVDGTRSPEIRGVLVPIMWMMTGAGA